MPRTSRNDSCLSAWQRHLADGDAPGRIDLYNAYNADEIFLTSTSLCICPARQVNGVAIGPKGRFGGR